MGALFVYILKSSVCLAVFYLFYRWLLSKDTFHRFNRFALLGILLLSLLTPCFEVTAEKPIEFQQVVVEWEGFFVPSAAEVPSIGMTVAVPWTPDVRWTWQKLILAIYLLGVLFFFFRNVYSLVRMAALLRKSKLEKLDDGITLVIHDCKLAPFSWMKYVVISASDLQEGDGEIIIHEREHIRHYHSLDLLVVEVTILLQWFNPVAWLFKRELQSIHEYEADEAVLNQGADAKQYQLLLIKKSVGTVRFNSLANSFNHSTLKKRIAMMLKRKSNPWARLKYLYILPLAVIVVTAFARPNVSDELDQISKLEVHDLVSDVERKVSETLLKEEVHILPEVERAVQADDVPAVYDTVFVDTSVFKKEDTVSLSVQPKKKATKMSESAEYLKDFLACHPYAWIVVNQREMRADEVRPEDFADNKSTITYYPLDMTRRFGRRAAGGVLLINTDEEFFKNVIVKNGSYEVISKAIKYKFLVLDGEIVFSDDFKLVDPCVIRSVAIEFNKVYVSTDVGYWVGSFIKNHPNALVVLHGKEIEAKNLMRRDYLGVRVISTFTGDESAQFGPKAKDGALFIGVIPYRYRLDSPKKKHNEFISSSSEDRGEILSDRLLENM